MRASPALLMLAATLPAAADTQVLIVQGLGGNEHYRTRFTSEVAAIEDAVATLAPAPTVRVFRETEADRDDILAHLADLAGRQAARDLLYVFLVGHGSFDDEEYKFNIRGPDLTAADLADALDGVGSGTQLIVNTSSASGAAADHWQSERRIVITATRSGRERHATHFGQYFAEALSAPAADVDKNRAISAQEAFNFADRQVAGLFEADGNLATEHARLDGQRADRLTLARLDVARPAGADRRLAALTTARDEVAGRIDALRLQRDAMPDEEYQSQLLELLLALAEAEEAIEVREAELARDD